MATAITTPIALGESHRTLAEMDPFLSITKILQPNLGRVGITGFMKIAGVFAGPVIPHVSIAMGPQVAAASTCELCEFNPNVLATANAVLAEPFRCESGCYEVPSAPGLGVEWNERLDTIMS